MRDNGIGIAPDQQRQIFDLFFQGPRNIDRSEGGLGIGLALMKSRFTIRLPARFTQSGKDVLPPVAEMNAVMRRVLVVDDNRDGADSLMLLLQAEGHTVRTAHDPLAALALLDGFLPDVAVLDIGLPVMDGYELAEEMRSRMGKHACRFFALSGYGEERDHVRSAVSGFDQHFVKPVLPDSILQAVRDSKASFGL